MTDPATAPGHDTAALAFLQATMTGLHSLCSQGPGVPFAAVGFYTDPAELLAAAHQQADIGRNVWWGVHPLRARPERGRGGNDDVAHLAHLVADLDWHNPDAHKANDGLPTEHEVRARLDAFTPAPTIVVETGHGLQGYWTLTRPVDPDLGARLTVRLHTALTAAGLVPDRHDLASVLRVPGTLNRKTSPPPLVRVGKQRPVVHDPAHLNDSLPAPLVIAPPPAREPLAPAPAGQREALDDDSIARWVADSVSWHALLAGDGWQLARHRGDQSEWVRPGKDPRSGISAVLHEPDGPLVVFSTSVPALQHPWAATKDGAGWTFGRFGYIAATRHRGDRSAAARDARHQRTADEMRGRVASTAAVAAQALDATDEPAGDEVVDLGPIMTAVADGTLVAVVPNLLEVTPT